ncbi:MAG TPA: tetratricopeptide repeat protein [Ktedonobacterales bacterium]
MAQTALTEGLRAVEAEIAANRAERALELCQQLQTRYPRALHVQRVLGEAFLALRKSREALGALDRALAGNPEDARAYCARAIVQQIQGDSTAALAWYHRACDITPDDAVLRSAYNELAAARGQPPYAPTRVGLARLYLRGDLYDHAIREWESILAEQPDHLEAQVGLAESLWRAGHLAAAVERCQRTLANVPSCVKPMLILAAIEHDAGRGDDAQRIMRRAAELDPDARIAQTLFADRLAAGDISLRALLFGEPRFTRPTGAPADARAATGRPAVRSQPVASQPVASQPRGDPYAPASGGPPPPMPPVPGPAPVPAPARPGALPPDFHTIFAETEYMLWDREEEESQARLARGAAQVPGQPPQSGPTAPYAGGAPPTPGMNGDTTAHMAAFVPPAMRQAGMTMDETEARAAINWISWLRAQGARAQGGSGGARSVRPAQGTGAGPLPPSAAAGGARPTRPVTPIGPGSLPTGPLPPPSPEALRQMFAELGDDTASLRIVEGQVVESSVAPQSPGAPPPRDTAGYDGADQSADVADAASPPDARVTREITPVDFRDEGDGGEEYGSDAPDASQQPVTLEELEGAYSGSGFRAMELHPGELALLASQNGLDVGGGGDTAGREAVRLPAEEHAAGDAPAQAPVVRASAAPAATGPAPEPAPVEREPQDYAERLERARRRRDDGALPEAVADYRLILKNAPDLLPDVLDDLDGLLAEHSDQPEVHRLAGDARIQQGDYLSAIEAYNRAVALSQAQND